MPFDPVPPRYFEIFSKAGRDASACLNEIIYLKTGGSFKDLTQPLPLKTVVNVYRKAMAFHRAVDSGKRREAYAEREAHKRGGHAAEILSPKGKSLGYTFYTEP